MSRRFIYFEYDCKQPLRKDLQKVLLKEFSKIVEAYMLRGTFSVKKQAAGSNFNKTKLLHICFSIILLTF